MGPINGVFFYCVKFNFFSSIGCPLFPKKGIYINVCLFVLTMEHNHGHSNINCAHFVTEKKILNLNNFFFFIYSQTFKCYYFFFYIWTYATSSDKVGHWEPTVVIYLSLLWLSKKCTQHIFAVQEFHNLSFSSRISLK